jgi:hypothetical protein
MDTEVALRVPTGGAIIRQADCALRSPAYVTWTERAGGIETLYAAPLLR